MIIGDNLFITSGTTPIVMTSVADLFVFTPPFPIDVIRWGIVVTTTYTAAQAILSLDKRVTAGSDTNRVAGAGGTITTTTAIAAGTYVYFDVPNATQPLKVDPGEQLVFKCTDLVAAGAGVLTLEFRRQPFVAGRIAHATAFTV